MYDIMVRMDRKSVKKYIYWGIFIAFVVGSIVTGSPFNFIDMIVVRPIVNILFVIFLRTNLINFVASSEIFPYLCSALKT